MLFGKSPQRPKKDPTARASLCVRDPTVISAFFGVYLGIDTRRWPELFCDESLPEDFFQKLECGPIGTKHWSVMRLGAYRSGIVPAESWALVFTSLERQGIVTDDPALLGQWHIDGNTAYPDNRGVIAVTPSLFEPLVVSPDAERERIELASCLGDRLLKGVGWNIVAMVHLKHT